MLASSTDVERNSPPQFGGILSTWSQRYRYARLVLDQVEVMRRGRGVTDLEFGERVAKRLKRPTPYSKSSVSQWGKPGEDGGQEPPVEVRRAIALECGVDPGWMDHGPDSQAPAPQGWHEPEPAERKSRRR
jgi:hypothetical protein